MPRYGRNELDQLYGSNIPQLCFSFDAVLSTVLGLTAIHYLSLDPNNDDMKRAARLYLDETLRQQSQLVSKITKENAEAAALVAMLIVTKIRHRAAFVHEDEPYKLPLEYFYMHHGATTIYHMCIPYLHGSNTLFAFGIEPPRFDVCILARDFLPSLIWEDSLSLLEGLDVQAVGSKVKSVYEGCLAYLDVIYMALLREEDSHWTRRRLHGMPTNVPRGFVDLLEQQDPRAMAILARFFALMKMCDGVRYHRGTAEFEVYGIMSLMPQDWLWAMEWPIQILNLSKLADCEVQKVEPDLMLADNLFVGELDFHLDDGLHLDTPLSCASLSSGEATPPSKSYPLTPLGSEPVGGMSRSGVSLPVRKCLEMRPVEREKVVLDAGEIFARHCASLQCSLEEFSQTSPHLINLIDSLSVNDISEVCGEGF